MSVREVNVLSAKYYKDLIDSNFNAGIELTTLDSDIVYVPIDSDNTDYLDILTWVGQGNIIQDAD